MTTVDVELGNYVRLDLASSLSDAPAKGELTSREPLAVEQGDLIRVVNHPARLVLRVLSAKHDGLGTWVAVEREATA